MKSCGMLQAGLSWLKTSVSRKKGSEESTSPLARVLSLFDLTLLGVGTTLGVGVYVMAGQVARDQTGPAVVVSFAIAAVASLLAGFCYAEFAARVPRAGSAYVYAYVAVGELIAFIIGWTLILEYAIGTAGVSRAVTGYVDNLANNATSEFFRKYLPMNVEHLAPYPDFIAFTFVMVLSALLSVGVKESSYLNSILTGLNLITIVTVVIAGSMHVDPANWAIAKEDIPAGVPHVGTGGFAPFGFRGIIQGAATSFFGYVGFDIIATTSEEAKNPRRNIPLSIMISLFIVFLTYFSMATVLTMMVPYYSLDKEAPYPAAFDALGMTAIKWIVTIGGIFALNTSLIGGMFPLPRILFSMSRDGLLFEFFGRVNSCTKTPVIATMLSGLLSSVMVLLFDLRQLIDMMSIGTLMAYSLVALCVMILRFTEDAEGLDYWSWSQQSLGALVNAGRGRRRRPTSASGALAMGLLAAFCAAGLALCGVMSWSANNFYEGRTAEVAAAIALAVLLAVILALLSRQPQADASKLSFAVPCMPLVPCLSILLNMYLMTELSAETWTRFIVWLILGAIVYFSYSIRYSKERRDIATVVTAASTEVFAMSKSDLRI